MNQKCYGLFMDGSKECHDAASFRLSNRISFAFTSRPYQRKLKITSWVAKNADSPFYFFRHVSQHHIPTKKRFSNFGFLRQTSHAKAFAYILFLFIDNMFFMQISSFFLVYTMTIVVLGLYYLLAFWCKKYWSSLNHHLMANIWEKAKIKKDKFEFTS